MEYVRNNLFWIKPERLTIVYAGEIPWCEIFQNIDDGDGPLIKLTRYYHLEEVEDGFDKSTYVPSKSLCNYFNLKKRGRYFDFFDTKGEIAVCSFEMRNQNEINGLLIYFRKDILQKYKDYCNGVFFQKMKIVVNYLSEDAHLVNDVYPNEFKKYKEKHFILFPLQGKKYDLLI